MKIPVSFSRLALFGAALALSAQMASAEPGQATVTAVRGSAQINNAEAKKGDQAGPGASIVTGIRSEISMHLYENGPTLVVGEDSRVTFEELTADISGPEAVTTTKLKLDAGRISGRVKKMSDQSSYTVTTPSITAAIRGTKYMITADGFVYVWEGCVDVNYTGSYRNEDDRNRLGNQFEVCAGQAFDPGLPGIIVNPYPEPPIGATTGKNLLPPDVRWGTDPVGPNRPVSPVQPFHPGPGPVIPPSGE